MHGIDHVIRRLSTGDASRRRSAFSLVELLVASTIALMVMGAVAQLFSLFSRTLSQSQATVDISGRMRNAAWQLRQDLAGVTVDTVPWTEPESDSGYFELLEGPQRDSGITRVSIEGDPDFNLEADTDDTLLFTTRSAGVPFVGRYAANTIESQCAEVAWFCRAAGTQPTTDTTVYNLYRRQLLVVGYAGQAPFSTNANNAAAVPSLWQASESGQSRPTQLYDLSLRLEGGLAVPNSLGDLTKRENRCFLSGTGQLRTGTFPYAFLIDGDGRALADATFDSTDRVWEDVILTNVISFDVRVYDPGAKAQPTTTPSLLPGDPGYNSQNASSGAGAAGAYVDLGWGWPPTPPALVSGTPAFISGTFPPAGQTAFQSAGRVVRNSSSNNSLPVATYDTWSLHYEFNGEDEDGDGVVDEGTNGADDNGDDLPDNPPEYETSPPYPVPLKGIEVRIRCYEPTSKQVRQITLRHAFTKD
jgi:type II secretory pathway pseudopilin PulG